MKERMMDMKQKILTAREKEIFEKLSKISMFNPRNVK